MGEGDGDGHNAMELNDGDIVMELDWAQACLAGRGRQQTREKNDSMYSLLVYRACLIRSRIGVAKQKKQNRMMALGGAQ